MPVKKRQPFHPCMRHVVFYTQSRCLTVSFSLASKLKCKMLKSFAFSKSGTCVESKTQCLHLVPKKLVSSTHSRIPLFSFNPMPWAHLVQLLLSGRRRIAGKVFQLLKKRHVSNRSTQSYQLCRMAAATIRALDTYFFTHRHIRCPHRSGCQHKRR